MGKVYIGGNTIETTATMNPRDPHDHYQTEAALVRAYFLQHPMLMGNSYSRVLDVGAGSGVWGSCVNDPFTDVDGVEIQERFTPHPAYRQWITDDFLKEVRGTYNAVIGNPPFKHAEEFFFHAYRHLEPSGNTSIIFLLRLGFLASLGRYSRMYANGFAPSLVTVLSTRPSFSGNSSTYPGDFCVMRWDFHDLECDERSELSFLVYDR